MRGKNKPSHPHKHLSVFLPVISLLIFNSINIAPVHASPGIFGYANDAAHLAVKSFTLDHVNVDIQATGLPAGDFVTAEPGAASQVATLSASDPYREFSITAAPYGTKPGTESLPPATEGGRVVYEQALRDYRIQQGGLVQDGSTALLFGQEVRGWHTLVDLFIDGPLPRPVMIDEWVAEAGNRLWILRVSREQATGGILPQSTSAVEELVLDSSSLANPTSVNGSQPETMGPDTTLQVNTVDLPTPSWWQGDCEYNYYYSKSGGMSTYRLGGIYLGVPACGPRPYYDGAPDVIVQFHPGSWGEYEWECVELSMRYLYLSYGISPYPANGSGVVWNYAGIKLEKITNGTADKAPRAGDVLSYGSTSTWGHTSVVSASAVNASGDGTITVIEQNASPTGISILNVSQWVVAGNAGAVSGWLHDPAVSYTTFADVPFSYWAHDWIESFYHAGVTTGCGQNLLVYCPDDNVTRAEMAVFILRIKDGLTTPVPAQTCMFSDVPITGKEWMEPWIDQFYLEGITSGCNPDPLSYCPEDNVTRAEMAVFILRAIHAPGWVPPASTGIFADVPVPGKEWMQPWIEEFYREGITVGCNPDPLSYCPEDNVTRAEMAAFIDRAFHIP